VRDPSAGPVGPAGRADQVDRYPVMGGPAVPEVAVVPAVAVVKAKPEPQVIS
jgi:hypothetical protein